MLSMNMLKKNSLYVGLVILTAIALYFIVRRYRSEGFESKVVTTDDDAYKNEIRQLSRENDVAKDMYPQQAVSQETVPQQQADYAQNMETSDALKNQFDDLQPEELLPADDEADAWANTNPKSTGSLEMKNFLEAGNWIGTDTQANTLRNANLSLRSDPPIERRPVSIWQQSTISNDPYRRDLQIGN